MLIAFGFERGQDLGLCIDNHDPSNAFVMISLDIDKDVVPVKFDLGNGRRVVDIYTFGVTLETQTRVSSKDAQGL